MYIWDGTDRQEGDVEAAFADMVRRTFINRNPRMLSSMKRYVAGCSLALTGRTSAALCAPEPVVQGGFTPSDDERAAMCRAVYASGRDVIHICFRTVEPLVPTGLIVVVYHDGDRVRLHSRTSLVWIDNEQRVGLYGVEDENDQYCHFILRQGRKMKRADGIPTRAEPREMRCAADHLEQLVARGAANDVRDEHFVCFHDGTHRPEPQRSDVRFTL